MDIFVCRVDIIFLGCYIDSMFNTISARQIQREYKKVLKNANRSKEPVVVMSHNKPLGAIIGLELLEKLQLEFLIKNAVEESKANKTVVISSESDLTSDLQELEQYVNPQD